MSLEMDPDRIYVVDADNIPLAVMDPEEIHRQNLMHRGFLLLIADHSGHHLLRRHGKEHTTYPGRWDIPASGHVAAGEAAEIAAEMRIPSAVSTSGIDTRHLQTLWSGMGTGNEVVEVFEVRLSDQEARALATDPSFLLVDQDEMTALVSSYSEQLTPRLLKAWEMGLLQTGPS